MLTSNYYNQVTTSSVAACEAVNDSAHKQSFKLDTLLESSQWENPLGFKTEQGGQS